MASASIIVYDPIDNIRDKRDYWTEYVIFYEQFWGGPTSPYGVWFGREYENFRDAISNHLGVSEAEVEDCYFMKDKDGRYYVSPFQSQSAFYAAHSENQIPLEWFLLFTDEERESFFTPWGFAGISYDTKISRAIERLERAGRIIEAAFQSRQDDTFLPDLFAALGDVQIGYQEIRSWLGGFDPSGYVVLNYGEIASFIHPYAIDKERSVREMSDVLAMVSEGRLEEAAVLISVMSQKWDEIRQKASGAGENLTVQ
ncbi:MAG: hypothetical protein ACT4NX_02260 [Deltaproteobacteria bacterium]